MTTELKIVENIEEVNKEALEELSNGKGDEEKEG